jgi:hypothetical protein
MTGNSVSICCHHFDTNSFTVKLVPAAAPTETAASAA